MYLKLEAAAVDAVLFHLRLRLLFLQENVFGKLPHGSLSPDTVAGVLRSIDGYRRSISRYCAQTRQVQNFDICFIVT